MPRKRKKKRKAAVIANSGKLSPAEYERITSKIEAALFEQVEGIKPGQVKHGSTNLWEGIAGHAHQIDVSVEGEKTILLVECKCWKKAVKVPPFLTFLGRILDIRLKHEGGKQIYGAVATTIGFESGGIEKLADYYKIDLHHVASPTEFSVKYKNLFSISTGDSVGLADEVLFDLNPTGKSHQAKAF